MPDSASSLAPHVPSAGIPVRLPAIPGVAWLLAAMCLVFAAAAPGFVSAANLGNVLQQASVLLLLALPMTLIILTEGLDLSMGAALSVCTLVLALVQIATGSTEGIYFPVGQAMAGLISHPPGVGRCETATVCGPSNVILSARTSQGAADNLRAVNQGLVDSGLAQGDTTAAAVAGRGAFRRTGKLSHLRVIAALFSEEAQLVVAADSGIQTVQDLRGKRVMLGSAGSGALERSHQILTAFHVPWWRVKAISPDQGDPAQLLLQHKLDAYFVVSGVPLDSVTALIRAHAARLVPIDGAGRDSDQRRREQPGPGRGAGVQRTGAVPGRLGAGDARTFPSWHVHDVHNDTDQHAVSLHAYAPKLAAMTRYRLVDGRLEVTEVERAGASW